MQDWEEDSTVYSRLPPWINGQWEGLLYLPQWRGSHSATQDLPTSEMGRLREQWRRVWRLLPACRGANSLHASLLNATSLIDIFLSKSHSWMPTSSPIWFSAWTRKPLLHLLLPYLQNIDTKLITLIEITDNSALVPLPTFTLSICILILYITTMSYKYHTVHIL